MLVQHRHHLIRNALLLTATAALTFVAQDASAQPCLSMDPADWPAPAKPYFMLVVDTSGSMTACTNPPTSYDDECPSNYTANSCSMVPTRVNDAKCALRQTVQAFSGEVNFGMATYGTYLTNCPNGACQSDCLPFDGGSCGYDIHGCDFNVFPDTTSSCGNWPECVPGAGPGAPNYPEGSWLNGGNVVVPMLQDSWWSSPPPTNVDELLLWFDGDCTDEKELYAGGSTPTAGALRAAAQYYRAGWSRWSETNYCGSPTFTHATPLDSQDRECRSVNILLVTDGNPSDCETGDDQTNAENVAADLALNGVDLGGKNWPVRTYVINFAGGNQQNADDLADAGDDGLLNNSTDALFATNEVSLAQGLAEIITTAIRPEECNNGDDNCNGCIDEGYLHYCNDHRTAVARTTPPTGADECCAWGTNMTERANCLADYEASIATSPPNGNLALLPCIDPTEADDPDTWLCYDPLEICDNYDNNCQGVAGVDVDEGFLKCPNCPSAEVCDGVDNNCDGTIDEGCLCSPSAETCDGCDNDCDDVIDNNPPPGGFPGLPCGLPGTGVVGTPPEGPPLSGSRPTPMYCEGTRECLPPMATGSGPCDPSGRGYDMATCTYGVSPLPAEVCDGWDNDCNGIIDDNLGPLGDCDPPGWNSSWVVGGTAPCQRGTYACVNGALQCQGGVLADTEVCDGIDNDCSGTIDDGGPFPGEGTLCGSAIFPCTQGNWLCSGGAMICNGGTQPQLEICDGIDNDCDGSADDHNNSSADPWDRLQDWPNAGQSGCWNIAGSSCSHFGFSWDPPPGSGAGCYDSGTLTSPCHHGTLACVGGAWTCQGDIPPEPEVCDGIDNDCTGVADDNGPFVGEGEVCAGPNVGRCVESLTVCNNGALDCPGGVYPTDETCNGYDDNCNGTTDDNTTDTPPPCDPAYDTNDYPGPNRILNAPCQPGVSECVEQLTETGTAQWTCVGGQAPEPELCDGQDNDCDTNVDEVGTAPDGINGTANPNPPPDAVIGDACGETVGQCEPGAYGCLNGLFACLGAVGPTVERCDCVDNDCDDQVDETDPPICSAGKDCVVTPDECVCAGPCGGGEYPCPTGMTCITAQISGGTGQGNYCVPDYDILCGDCASKTVTDAGGQVVCAPPGTDAPGCLETPVCVCSGQSGCQAPCFDVQCSAGLVCSNFGPTPGECVQDNCYFTGCPGCDRACHDGTCLDNPCTADTCADDEVCRPTADFTGHTCVGSCAEVDCEQGQQCQDGQCVSWCDPPCDPGTVCDPSGPSCVTDQCIGDGGADPCALNGSCCDPLSGQCGDCPCEGVVCPEGQRCEDDQCIDDGGGGGAGGGSAGGGGPGGSGTGATGPGGGSGTGAGSQADPNAVWRQSTGGGGCACELARPRSAPSSWPWLGLLGLALGLGARRRRPAAQLDATEVSR